MQNTNENDLLFDDVKFIENRLGKSFPIIVAGNLSPDGNCSSYVSIDDNDCTNNSVGNINHQ
ncbi:hypothetical protein [Arcicella rosea]|uniref:Uncharacterized protein n=1 Tax=Arcicella rosea TaxID=502909 RepID=A0A841EGN0_9BACT|nr:hypothetical protein [Arcicella rosea]MBB6001454.1 hypothetical protein [Arcicella rosea]